MHVASLRPLDLNNADAHQYPKPPQIQAKPKNKTPVVLTSDSTLTSPDPPLQVCLFDVGPVAQERDTRKIKPPENPCKIQ